MTTITKSVHQCKFDEFNLKELGFEKVHYVNDSTYYYQYLSSDNNLDDILFMSWHPEYNYVSWYVDDLEMKNLYTIEDIEEVINFFKKYCCE